MFDFKTGKVECNRFRIEYGDTEELFKKRFVANCIKYNTHYFYNPDIIIGSFVATEARITFHINGKVASVDIVFAGDPEQTNHFELNKLIESLSEFVPCGTCIWNTKYGTIHLIKFGNDKLFFHIKYDQWDVSFRTNNQWNDILWSFTKLQPTNHYCMYRKWTFYDGDVINFEYCKIYATHHQCENCKRNCKYSKVWGLHDTPTYKELEREIQMTETVIDDVRVELGEICLTGVLNNSSFIMSRDDGEINLTLTGSLSDLYTMCAFVDKIAHITSDWYKNQKI